MSQIPANKSGLERARATLGVYRKALPALDMNRRQLVAARAEARAARRALAAERVARATEAAAAFPMLADGEIPLTPPPRPQPQLRARRDAGVPSVEIASWADASGPEADLAAPPWAAALDRVVEALARLEIAEAAAAQREAALDAAVRKMTKRVNLFEKRLIPELEAEIRRIALALADAERAGVVVAKIAKARRAAETAEAAL